MNRYNKERPIFHRRFQVLEPSYQDQGMSWYCTSRIGLIKAFLAGKEISYAGKNKWYDFNKK